LLRVGWVLFARTCQRQQPGTGLTRHGLHLKPGELDTYYGIWSGGHTGDMRVLGLPSGREIHRIPCFVPDALVGWGITNESKKIMGTKPDGSLRYTVADTHHTHASYKDGNYDGRYAWINDKINSRIARASAWTTSSATRSPSCPTCRASTASSRTRRPGRSGHQLHHRVCSAAAEFSIPAAQQRRRHRRPTKYRSLFTCVDAETMEVRWQVLIDGNCDLVATSYDGKLAATNQYNTEMGVHYEDMMSAERDACLFFNIARIEEAVKAASSRPTATPRCPWSMARANPTRTPRPRCGLCERSQEPARRERQPRRQVLHLRRQALAHRHRDRTAKVLDWFDGKLEKLDEAIVAEVEMGLGPLHTAFDGRGNAYTTLFLDSQVVKWNVDAAIKFHAGDKTAKYVVDRLDVQYQPGHINASQSETKAADGKYLAVGCKFSKDRFLPVGPLHPENEQLIDISGDKMVLLADHPVRGEPHDFIIFKRDLLAQAGV
jgi:nitrous-oxide reductase